MEKHGPTPWRIEYGHRIIDANDELVVSCGRGGNNEAFIQEGLANINLIVEAVNHYTRKRVGFYTKKKLR